MAYIAYIYYILLFFVFVFRFCFRAVLMSSVCGVLSAGYGQPFMTPGTTIEHAAFCDYCRSPIKGIRYRCSMCPNYDLCGGCIDKDPHGSSHIFLRVNSLASANFPIVANRAGLIHPLVTCAGCAMSPLVGYRYACHTCRNINLCEACEARGFHDPSHPRVKYAQPAAPEPASAPACPSQAMFGMIHQTSGRSGAFSSPAPAASPTQGSERDVMFGMIHQTSGRSGAF